MKFIFDFDGDVLDYMFDRIECNIVVAAVAAVTMFDLWLLAYGYYAKELQVLRLSLNDCVDDQMLMHCMDVDED